MLSRVHSTQASTPVVTKGTMASVFLDPAAGSQRHWTQLSIPSPSPPDGFQEALLPWFSSNLTSRFFTDALAGPSPSPQCLWLGLETLSTDIAHVLLVGFMSSNASHEMTPSFVSPARAVLS